MEITVSAPHRIDLAGGTTDLYPLYLLMEGGCTVNAAISIRSSVVLRTRKDGFRIESLDMESELEAHSLDLLPVTGPFSLIGRTVRTCPPPFPLEIVTRNEAPRGSGLGASSSLVVALLKGLLRLRSEAENPVTIVSLGMSIETAVLGVPAGSQDHIAAEYGGLSVIEFGHRGFVRRPMEPDSPAPEFLNTHIVLSYTGEGRFSGMNNWEITKGFIDGNAEVRKTLISIRDVAIETGNALFYSDWAALPILIDKEWELRKKLAPGVSTSRIESIMLATKRAGALANKICGAGGGGCMITFVEPAVRRAVEQAVIREGGQVIPFHVDPVGASLEVNP
jgi:D-glycero-alpha-D-manno-heptose-7-phosphate kinase